MSFPRVTRRAAWLAIACLSLACTAELETAGQSDPRPGGQSPDPISGTGAPSTTPNPPTDVPMVERQLLESTALLLNPARGYYVGVDLRAPTGLDQIRADGHTMVIALVDLGPYRDSPLDDQLLDDLQAGFDAGVAAGIKYVLRFAYDYSSAGQDAPLSRVLQHIEQLAPLLSDNADVIGVLQAGFVGAWGEWHSSANGLDGDAERTAILSALLDAMPAHRYVQVRTPMAKEDAFPGGPITDSIAFSSNPRARIGHHNDCFLASNSDYGTFADPVQDWLGYVAMDTRFTPIGGETCHLYAPKTDCDAAVANLESQHWSYLNAQYNQQVLGEWENQGCAEEIEQRLGYRLVVERLSFAGQISAGETLPVALDIVNRGFAAPFNRRPAYLVLFGNGRTVVRQVSGTDPRTWAAGEQTQIVAGMPLPDDLPPGNYSLALWLPDDAPSLAADSRYAIRLANQGVWDPDTGYNLLTDEIIVVD